MREWDKGKSKGKGKERARDDDKSSRREGERAGRKRKAEEIDHDDGYANKKERVAAASRKAPWASNVDWMECTNVAEMYVPFKLFICGDNADHRCSLAIGCTAKLRRLSTTCLLHLRRMNFAL